MHKVDTVVLHSLLQSGHDIYIASDYGTDPITGQHIGNRQPMFTNSAAKLMRETPKKSQLDFHMTESERKEWAVPQLQRKTKELGRLPNKADFDEYDVRWIKEALGAGHRTQEAAGLKERKPQRGGTSKWA